jgi:hypothetical protein
VKYPFGFSRIVRTDDLLHVYFGFHGVQLGEDSVRELRSFAGLDGEYVPERLFGASGKEAADAVRADNREVGDGLEAQIKEWTDS